MLWHTFYWFAQVSSIVFTEFVISTVVELGSINVMAYLLLICTGFQHCFYRIVISTMMELNETLIVFEVFRLCVGNSYVFQNGLYDFIFNQFIEDLQHCAKIAWWSSLKLGTPQINENWWFNLAIGCPLVAWISPVLAKTHWLCHSPSPSHIKCLLNPCHFIVPVI